MYTSSPGSLIFDRHRPRLELIISEWQIAADLSFCDMVLWYPSGDSYLAHAQARPVTAQTSLPQDMTGAGPPANLQPVLEHVFTGGQPVVASDEYPYGPPGIAALPVVWQHETIDVVTLHKIMVYQWNAPCMEDNELKSAIYLFERS